VTKHVCKSTIFDGTIREYYLYVPVQYNPNEAAALMVFQDGHAYVNEAGDFRVPIVFDNLVHKKEMPVTIGVFKNQVT
jgi:enterochelin esterase family protein